MVDIIPEATNGNSRIEHFTLTYGRIMLDNLRYARDGMSFMTVEPGKYAKLVTGRGLEMSDTQMEWRTNREVIANANGRVLIAGLGLGLIIVPLLKKKEVTSIEVVELNKEVIELVTPHIKHEKLNVVHSCINDYHRYWKHLGGKKFDTIYFDIWPDIGVENLEPMTRLCRMFRGSLNKANPHSWMGCWTRDILRSMKRKGW